MIDLNGVWRLDSPRYTDLKATVPGSVLQTLLDHKLIEDPFYGCNEEAVRRELYDDYTLSRKFTLSGRELAKANYLCLSGIDTIADVYINGNLIAQLDDMHTDRKIHLNREILREENEIKIHFTSPYRYLEEYDDQGQFDTFALTQKKGPCIRKPHYMFGWDWGPDLGDMGVWGNISILSTDFGYLEDFRHRCTFREDGSALVTVEVNTELFGSGVLEATLSLESDGTMCRRCAALSRHIQFSFELPEPKRWYPVGFGDPTLYDLTFCLRSHSGEEQSYRYRIGLRQVVIDHSEDEYGTNFAVYINGCKVFLKGSCYIPEDNILSRVTPDHTRKLLELVKNFNHNCIRVWGGGYYPHEDFYDYCDENGILVWQDLMFACAVYSMKDAHFKDLIVEETTANIKRLRHHASIVIISGDNECEDGVNGHEPHLMENYRVMSLEVLVPLMKELTDTYFARTSPRSRVLFQHQNDLDHYDTHYWRVWCDDRPIETVETVYPRMLSEIGHQSFPMMETIRTFAEPADLAYDSPVMEHHQKQPGSNRRILNYVKDRCGEPEHFEDLVYLSQLVQADAMRLCAEHLRRSKFRCNGMLYWQLNDCWPGISWSSVDYLFGIKALHYASRRFFAEHLVSVKQEGTAAEIWIANDTARDCDYRLDLSYQTLDGQILLHRSMPASAKGASCRRILTLDRLFAEDRSDTVLRVSLYDWAGTLLSENHYQPKLDREITYPVPQLTVRTVDEYSFAVTADVFCKSVYIRCGDVDTVLSDNFFNLCAGETKVIHADRKVDVGGISLKCVNQVPVKK